jgi:hypothetical protein
MKQINRFLIFLSPFKRQLLLVAKILFLGLILYYITKVFVQKNEDFEAVKSQLGFLFKPNSTIIISIIIALNFINWALEAVKWQVLVEPVEAVSFLESYKGVLAGLSLGFISPANLGDMAGRMLTVKLETRKRSFGAVFMGSSIQTYITLFFGTIAFGYFIFYTLPESSLLHLIIFMMLIFGLTIGIILVQARQILSDFFLKISWLQRFVSYFEIINLYSINTILKALLFGTLRYAVFTFQFQLIFLVFQIRLPLADSLMIINLIFLTKTVVPTFNFLTDLGVRQISALYLFDFYGINHSIVIAAVFSLWLTNILLPVLGGTGIVLFSKFQGTKL